MKKYITTLFFAAAVAVSFAQVKKESSKGKTKTETLNKQLTGNAKIADLHAYQVYGESFKIQNTLTKEELAKVYDEMKSGDVIENIQFVSTIESVCKKKGCWMKVDLGKQEEQSFVRFKDYGFFMPLDGEKSSVIVHGKAVVSEISVEKLKHYAEDAGESAAEIAKITQPKLQFNFEADGVYVKEN